MATANSPIELPTGRRSIYFDQAAIPNPDVHDPNWIPVLDSNAIKGPNSVFSEKEVSPYNQASFSPFPTAPASKQASRPQSPDKRPQLSHSHSKSSYAPEAIPSELEGAPLPIRSSSRRPAVSPHSEHLRDNSDGHDTSTSDADGSTAPSTAGTTSLLEEQYYTLPTMEVAKEDLQPPAPPISARSSLGAGSMMSSKTKSPFAPTSKYNRKGVQSIVSINRPATIQSQPSTPHESPKVRPNMPTPASAPISAPPAPPEPLASPKLASLQSSKSTASERRYRALHSHPSNNSMHEKASPQLQSQSFNRSRANSKSGEIDIEALPRPPSVRHKPRKSGDASTSRPTTPRSIYDYQQPTPAPTAPLPQLPPEAFTAAASNSRRQSIRTIRAPSEAHIASASIANVAKPADHSEMADFMSRKSTVVFRRFDDVHVKLLLCLQDEITQLEEEMFALDNDANAQAMERPGQKMRVMRELRRVVAEYDHLFANWSQMQANKATPEVMADLRQWLENPKTSAGAAVDGAKDDLKWLKSQKDLSSVTLGEKGGDSSTEKGENGPSVQKSSAGGALAALFNCAGKRK
ncbi:uncharacterized protein HMPREF1541_05168 [Cyphellophora europaea CBS 101466]|uniref:DUF6594 domain-containing protein n=1 Tax=Cyphellophora europaea (strain CBS 101466) TaxID=1220924 RepID=W2RYP2_CYPE1|nr:uncharacterized protein HMPREF1541_05168 [Cyphellophora europaea CBS 101466]ETN40888.1 hypothetical protein HMPREF1541_05168 [Cyphellophora europaea CBS 101466]